MLFTSPERKTVAMRAAENMAKSVFGLNPPVRSVRQEILINKKKFIGLLQANFDRIDKDSSRGISRAEIVKALADITDYQKDATIALMLLLRYFDFIADMVADGAEEEKVISRADVDTLAEFLIHSELSLDALCEWCTNPGAQ